MTPFAERLNALRAAVLGANDGIVSVGALLIAVAAAKPAALFVTALGAILAGAASMAVGEYVSVHAQLDAEAATNTAPTVSPIRAAAASAASFVSGAVLPTAAVLCAPAHVRVPVTVMCILAALGVCGYAAARMSDIAPARPVQRVVLGGAAALLITYAAGLLTG